MSDKPEPEEIQKEFNEAVKQHQAKEKIRDAAPDMLEALQNIENDDEHMPDSAWQLIQAAISKATN